MLHERIVSAALLHIICDWVTENNIVIKAISEYTTAHIFVPKSPLQLVLCAIEK
jgi:hypothetical protein